MKKPVYELRLKIQAAVAAACLVASGCTTSGVSACRDDDPRCTPASLTVRVFDDSSDARYNRPTLRPVTSSLNRKVAGGEEPVASMDESGWSLSDLPPGTYVLRITVGGGAEKRKTVTERFRLDSDRGKVVKVVLANRSAAVWRSLLVVAGCVVVTAAVVAATLDPLGDFTLGP